MQGTHLTATFFDRGGDDADKVFSTQFPFPVQLVGVTARCSADTSFIVDIGDTDADAYLDEKTVTGHATTHTSFGRADFVGGEYPHIDANTPIIVTVDHDGGAGTDGINMSITLIFTEG